MEKIKIKQSTLGDSLLTIRTALNLNQQEFSDALTANGYKIAKVTYRQIETKVRGLSYVKYFALTNTIRRAFREELERREFELDIEI